MSVKNRSAIRLIAALREQGINPLVREKSDKQRASAPCRYRQQGLDNMSIVSFLVFFG